MSKTEYAWVIQRDDGMFWNCSGDSTRNYATYFVDSIARAYLFTEEYIKTQPIDELIKFRQLENCRIVKVEIKVVGE